MERRYRLSLRAQPLIRKNSCANFLALRRPGTDLGALRVREFACTIEMEVERVQQEELSRILRKWATDGVRRLRGKKWKGTINRSHRRQRGCPLLAPIRTPSVTARCSLAELAA